MLGHDADPGVIAQQTLNGPWADEWLANVVDDKPLPFEMTASYKQWGDFGATPLWKRSYLGRHYGLATIDVAIGNQTVPLMAQWRRDDRPADTHGAGRHAAGALRREPHRVPRQRLARRRRTGIPTAAWASRAASSPRSSTATSCWPSPRPIRSSSIPATASCPTNITSVQTSIALARPAAKADLGDLPRRPARRDWPVAREVRPAIHHQGRRHLHRHHSACRARPTWAAMPRLCCPTKANSPRCRAAASSRRRSC